MTKVPPFALTVLASQAIFGQPAFEVASVKPAAPVDSRRIASGSTGIRSYINPGQVSYANYTLKSLLMRAYHVKSYQLSGPAWLDSERYDIVATLPEGASRTQIPAMMQNLLTERFRMKVHWETKPQRGYALVVGKNEPHLKESSQTTEPTAPGDVPLPISLSFSSDGHSEFIGVTLAAFADMLSNYMDRPLVDMTGIQGSFDITLNVTMEDLIGLKSMISAGDPNPTEQRATTGSIFSALKDIGLKLESRNTPIKQIVVDTAQRVPLSN